MATTFEDVKEIIADKLSITNKDTIEPGSRFTVELGADSLDVVEIIMELEKKFDITISDEDAGKMSTVEDAVKYIDAHRK